MSVCKQLCSIGLICFLALQSSGQNANRALEVGSTYQEVIGRNELKPKDHLTFFPYQSDSVTYYLCSQCKSALDWDYPADIVALAFYRDTLFKIAFGYQIIRDESEKNFKKAAKTVSKRFKCSGASNKKPQIVTDIPYPQGDTTAYMTIETKASTECSLAESVAVVAEVKTVDQADQSFRQYGMITFFDPRLERMFSPKRQ